MRAVVVLGERGCEEGYLLRLLFLITIVLSQRKGYASNVHQPCCSGGRAAYQAWKQPSLQAFCRVCMYEGSMHKTLAIVRHCLFLRKSHSSQIHISIQRRARECRNLIGSIRWERRVDSLSWELGT